MTKNKKMDLVLVNPGGQKLIYQSLSQGLTAPEQADR